MWKFIYLTIEYCTKYDHNCLVLIFEGIFVLALLGPLALTIFA